LRGVDLAVEALEQRVADRVVHQPVKVLIVHPSRIYFPDLAEDIGIWICRFDNLTEASPKGIVIDFVRNIESPSIHAGLDPVTGYIQDIFSHLGIVCIEFGQGFEVPPGSVIFCIAMRVGIKGEVVNMKPVFVRGMFPVFEQVRKGEKTA